MTIFKSDLLQIIFCLNKLCSLPGDTSLALRRLVSTKNSTNFFSTFSLVNHAVMKSNWVHVNYGSKKNFETEISAHVGCALATPNFLDLASTNPVTSSLNRIFVTFFLEKKSGGGKPGFPPPQRRNPLKFWTLSWAVKLRTPFVSAAITAKMVEE